MQVNDISDTTPVFDTFTNPVSIAENTGLSTSVTTLRANGTGSVVYSLTNVTDAGNAFLFT